MVAITKLEVNRISWFTNQDSKVFLFKNLLVSEGNKVDKSLYYTKCTNPVVFNDSIKLRKGLDLPPQMYELPSLAPL